MNKGEVKIVKFGRIGLVDEKKIRQNFENFLGGSNINATVTVKYVKKISKNQKFANFGIYLLF